MTRALVTFVEGRGDVAAVPAITRRVLRDVAGNDVLHVDPDPFRVRGLGSLVKDGYAEWHRFLQTACRRPRPPAAVLLVLDGERDPVPRNWKAYVDRHGSAAFCAYRVAAELAFAARAVRAGEAFSLAVTLAVPEFEAWLLGGIEGLRGAPFIAGVVGPAVAVGDMDVERRRDAKKPLAALIPGYSETLDQGTLAARMSIEGAHRRSRSFRRLRSAIAQLADAVRSGRPISAPALPPA